MEYVEKWRDLNYLQSGDLICQAFNLMDYNGAPTPFWSVEINKNEYNFDPLYTGENLYECITLLQKVGFNILFRGPRYLNLMLKDNIEPVNCERGEETYFIKIFKNKLPIFVPSYLVNNMLGSIRFKFISSKDRYFINSVIEDNEITSNQLINSMKELGWV